MWRILATLLLLLPLAANAAAPLPVPDARYGDPDPAAMALQARPGDAAGFRRRLDAAIRQDPRNAVALVHRAYLFHAGGDRERGDRDFLRVLELTDADPVNHRRAFWSLGWSAFNRGEPGHALAYWRQAGDLHGGLPFWYPYTMAVGLWAQGDQAAALAWYDAAARSNPQWSQPEGVALRTRHWRDRERQVVQAMFEAWTARSKSTGI
jgi:tetratricopeptide (TPR) repeat protein